MTRHKMGLIFLFLFSVSIILYPLISNAKLQSQVEIVMKEGTIIEVEEKGEKLNIIAGKKYNRRYEWDDCGLESNLRERKGRWYGNNGIYNPGAQFFSMFSDSCKGISRAVVQEGQIHFKDADFLKTWLKRYSKYRLVAWTNTGLLVKWWFNQGRNQIAVNLWQICINGKKPTNLAGANDQAFNISNQLGLKNFFYKCVQVDEKEILKTRKQWEDDWRKFDKILKNFKKYKN